MSVALELDIKTVRGKNGLSFTVQILKQKYRGDRATYVVNGFAFVSLGCPAIGTAHNNGDYSLQPMLYLRGGNRRKDDMILRTRSIGYIEKLKTAVIEYNEHYKATG